MAAETKAEKSGPVEWIKKHWLGLLVVGLVMAMVL
jgi:hypothetical protein